MPVADPGFPIGGVDLVGRGVDSRGGYVLKILYVKTKELGPLGGRAPLDPPMNAVIILQRELPSGVYNFSTPGDRRLFWSKY